MKHSIKAFFFLITGMFALVACNNDVNESTWEEYKEWREANDNFFNEQKYLMTSQGNYYQTIIPSWNNSAQILIRYLNDRKLTAGNLSPLLTSTVDVKYIGRLYNGEPFDSSYNLRTNGDSIYRTDITGLIQGWQIALMNMNVGDSVEIVVPYNMGYGSSATGSIKPYSTLIFNLKLVDIPFYEVRP